jgi:hypothetical protein
MATADDVRRIYTAILFELERISVDDLTELITEAWLARAPEKLADEFGQR